MKPRYNFSTPRTKRKLSRVLVPFFVGIIIIGIYGIVSMKASDEKKALANAGVLHYPDLEIAKVAPSTPSQIKEYKGFTLSFNKLNKTPNWVGWELLASELNGKTPRSNKFWTDADITGCPTTYDYRKSEFDRGHMSPAAEHKWDSKAMNDSFSLANICPQNHALNTGAWNRLEEMERRWANRDSAIIIVAGPIYQNSDTKTIGENRVRVPSAFYKVIIAPYVANPRGIGFIFPNMSSPGSYLNYAMTIDEIEKITGIDFFSSLPDSLENAIESNIDAKEWSRR